MKGDKVKAIYLLTDEELKTIRDNLDQLAGNIYWSDCNDGLKQDCYKKFDSIRNLLNKGEE